MPENIRVFCNSCRQTTRHSIPRIFEQVMTDGQIVHWQTIQCAGCDEVSFLEKHFTGVDAEEQVLSVLIYPTRMKQQQVQIDGLPDKLDRIYREMIQAFNNESYILCAGGLRALVEGICAEQNISDGPKRSHTTGEYDINPETGKARRGRTLECKIEGLAEKHILTQPHARVLHEHRYLGNSALHELEAPSSEIFKIAISIIEHVMVFLYSFPAQAGNLTRMRGKNHNQELP